MLEHSAWEIVPWIVLGFFIAGVVFRIEVRRMATDKPIGRIEAWLLKRVWPDLDKKTATIIEDRLASLARRQTKSAGRRLIGTCGCGCGQEVYYNGRGRRPIFVNSFHKEVYQGKRVALPTP